MVPSHSLPGPRSGTAATAELAVEALMRLCCDTPPASPVKGAAASPCGVAAPLPFANGAFAGSPGRPTPAGSATGAAVRAAAGAPLGAENIASWAVAPSGASTASQVPAPGLAAAADGSFGVPAAPGPTVSSPAAQQQGLTRFGLEHWRCAGFPADEAGPHLPAGMSPEWGVLRRSDDTLLDARLFGGAAIGGFAAQPTAGTSRRPPQRNRKQRPTGWGWANVGLPPAETERGVSSGAHADADSDEKWVPGRDEHARARSTRRGWSCDVASDNGEERRGASGPGALSFPRGSTGSRASGSSSGAGQLAVSCEQLAEPAGGSPSPAYSAGGARPWADGGHAAPAPQLQQQMRAGSASPASPRGGGRRGRQGRAGGTKEPKPSAHGPW